MTGMPDSCASFADALDEWVLGAYHDHLDVLLKHKALDGLEVVGLYGYVLAYQIGPSVAGGDKKFLHFRTLCNLPCQCMLASAAA